MFHRVAVKMLAVAFVLGALGVAQAAQPSAELNKKIMRKAAQAEKTQRLQSAVVDLTFSFEKEIRMKDVMLRRPRKGANAVVSVKNKTKTCQGVLLNTSHVATVADCAQEDDFMLTQVSLRFSNGKKAIGTRASVSVKDGVAKVLVKKDLWTGIEAAEPLFVSQGASLADTVEGAHNSLWSFFINHGVLSARANRFQHRAVTLKQGQPFFFNGKVAALVKYVPSRLPVSFWGAGLSEDSLQLFYR